MILSNYQSPTPSLDGMDKWVRAAYAVACLQRYVPLAARLDTGAPSRAVSDAATMAWQDVLTRHGSSDYESCRSLLAEVLSDYRSEISAVAGDLLQRIATIALHAIGAVARDDSSAKNAGSEAYGLQDLVASLALNVQAFDQTAESTILNSQYVRMELDEQNEDIRMLRSELSWHDAIAGLKQRAARSGGVVAGLVSTAVLN